MKKKIIKECKGALCTDYNCDCLCHDLHKIENEKP